MSSLLGCRTAYTVHANKHNFKLFSLHYCMWQNSFGWGLSWSADGTRSSSPPGNFRRPEEETSLWLTDCPSACIGAIAGIGQSSPPLKNECPSKGKGGRGRNSWVTQVNSTLVVILYSCSFRSAGLKCPKELKLNSAISYMANVVIRQVSWETWSKLGPFPQIKKSTC